MKAIEKDQRFTLVCKDEWLHIECSLSIRPLLRRLAVVTVAIVTIWGGPELLRFVQMLM